MYRLQIVEVDTVDPIDFKASFTGILLKNSEARKRSGAFLDFTAAANPKSMISKKICILLSYIGSRLASSPRLGHQHGLRWL